MTPYLAPWRLASLGAGIALLIAGSRYQPAPDWDVGVSVLMATCTYIAAPFFVDTLWRRRWTLLPLAILGAWFAVDGCYWLYWSLVDPAALVMRDIQWEASLCFFLICGMIWRRY